MLNLGLWFAIRTTGRVEMRKMLDHSVIRFWPYRDRGQWLGSTRPSGLCRRAAGCGWRRTGPRCWWCPTPRHRRAPGTHLRVSAPPHTPLALVTPSAGWASCSLPPCSWSPPGHGTPPGSRWSFGGILSPPHSQYALSPGGCKVCGPQWRSKPGQIGTAWPSNHRSWRSRCNRERWEWPPQWCHPSPILLDGPQSASACLSAGSHWWWLLSPFRGHPLVLFHLWAQTITVLWDLIVFWCKNPVKTHHYIEWSSCLQNTVRNNHHETFSYQHFNINSSATLQKSKFMSCHDIFIPYCSPVASMWPRRCCEQYCATVLPAWPSNTAKKLQSASCPPSWGTQLWKSSMLALQPCMLPRAYVMPQWPQPSSVSLSRTGRSR